MTEPSDMEMALDLLCAMRPNVPRSSFERFMHGDPGTPYLHIAPDEIMVAVAAIAAAREKARQEERERWGKIVPRADLWMRSPIDHKMRRISDEHHSIELREEFREKYLKAGWTDPELREIETRTYRQKRKRGRGNERAE